MSYWCSGTGKPSEQSFYWKNQAICPDCTKYVRGLIGLKTPKHKEVKTRTTRKGRAY